MREATRNTFVGLTAIFALLGLAYMGFIFGELAINANEGYRITVHLDSANGLVRGSRIHLNGLDIGSVSELKFLEDPTQGIEAFCAIRNEIRIPDHSEVRATKSLIGSGAMLGMVTHSPGKAVPAVVKFVPQDGTGRLSGKASSIDLIVEEMASSLVKDLRDQFKNIDGVSLEMQNLFKQYTEVGRKLNGLLEDRSPEDIKNGKAPNIQTVVARIDADLAELHTTLTTFNKLLGDPKMQEDIRTTIANARTFSDKANTVADETGKTIVDVRKEVMALSTKYVGVADDLSRTLKTMNALMAAAKDGKGTAGKLINDPALFDSFTDSAQRLSETLKEMKLLLQKWKAEGLPVKL